MIYVRYEVYRCSSFISVVIKYLDPRQHRGERFTLVHNSRSRPSLQGIHSGRSLKQLVTHIHSQSRNKCTNADSLLPVPRSIFLFLYRSGSPIHGMEPAQWVEPSHQLTSLRQSLANMHTGQPNEDSPLWRFSSPCDSLLCQVDNKANSHITVVKLIGQSGMVP